MFPFFPYTNFHELNADWILKTVKQVADSVSQFADNLAHVVRVTAQTFTPEEQRIACGNIKAVSYNTQSTSPNERTGARANLQAVGYEAQTLTEAEKTQARTNIGAADSNAIPDVSDAVRTTSQTFTADEQRTACGNIKAVSYNTQSASPNERTTARANLQAVGYEAQTLTEAEKTQARTNIGALGSSDVPVPEGAVLYNESQSLTDVQKATARNNIGAVSESDIPQGVVRYDTAQSLSDAYRTRARDNIGAEKARTKVEIISQVGGWYTQGVFATILAAVTNGETVEVFTKPINQNRVYRGFFQLNAAGTHLQADLFAMVENPFSTNATKWYRVDWNGVGVLNVTEEEGRFAPASIAADAGKVLMVSNSGVPVWTTPAGPLVVTFSGTNANHNASCDKTWAEISAAGTNIELWYQQQFSKTKLVPVIYQNSSVYGEFTYISDPTDIPGGYTSITCAILSNGGVECTIVDG